MTTLKFWLFVSCLGTLALLPTSLDAASSKPAVKKSPWVPLFNYGDLDVKPVSIEQSPPG